MARVRFPSEMLLEMCVPWGGSVEDRIIESKRWGNVHEVIFELNGKFFRTYYSVGATECQEESPWQDLEEVECEEVHKVKRVLEVWEPVSAN